MGKPAAERLFLALKSGKYDSSGLWLDGLSLLVQICNEVGEENIINEAFNVFSEDLDIQSLLFLLNETEGVFHDLIMAKLIKIGRQDLDYLIKEMDSDIETSKPITIVNDPGVKVQSWFYISNDYLNLLSQFKSSPKTRKIVLIIPTLNEEENIESVIKNSRKFVDKILIIDGNSTDKTTKIARNLGIKVYTQEGRGKGLGVRTALKYVKDAITVIIDGDGTYFPHEIPKLVQPILFNEADLVIGSRFLGYIEKGAITFIRKIANYLISTLINIIYRTKLTDTQSGFRAFNGKLKEVYQHELISQNFEIETEMTILALKRGFRIKEVAISYRKRKNSVSKLKFLTHGLRIARQVFRPLVKGPIFSKIKKFQKWVNNP